LIRTSSNLHRLAPTLSLCLVITACLFPLDPLACPARASGAPRQEAIKTSTELVKIGVSVLDKRGNFVGGLERENFRVLDNGSPQPIVFFMSVEAPAQVLVMVETSPAVYLLQNEHLLAAYALLGGLAADDQVSLATYDQAPSDLLAFTADKSALMTALSRIHYTIGMGELNFYDSVSAVLDWPAPEGGKRALVLLTTGLDSSPPEHWEALARKVRGKDILIFSVALGGTLRGYRGEEPKASKKATMASTGGTPVEPQPSDNSLSFAKADDALRSLATMTGGRAYFPQSPKDFAPIYREIASALRHEYVLGTAPAHDAQFHSLSVEILGGNSQPLPMEGKKAVYRVFARQGYLAPQP